MKKEFIISERRYDIDWLRIMLIFSVFLFHIGMYFNGFGWHIKNPAKVFWLDPIMAYLHTWRMPLLFLVSGAGTYFALGKRSVGKFIGERSRKLLIPLVFGMFVIVPPQIYIEKHEQYGSFLNFIPHIAEGSYPSGNLSWHHLWFVLYLFICALASIPFILMLRSHQGKIFYRFLEKVTAYKGVFLLLSIPLFISQICLLPFFPRETHALVNDWAYIAYSFLFFIYGYILLSDKKLVSNLVSQRRIFAGVAIALSALFFFDWFNSIDPYINDTVQIFLLCLLEIAMALALVSYAARYLNHDHPWRSHLNDAIYPFYILHQTVIIIVAYSLAELPMPIGIRALMITVISLSLCTFIYIYMIKPFKASRLVFGMHVKRRAGKPVDMQSGQYRAVS
jgi:peptidoglycan/LPS O-acetylase OafA/YrhL